MKESKPNLAKFATFMKAFEINCSVERITKDQLNLYFSVLKPYSISEVETAFARVMHSWQYNKLPTVGVFIKAIEDDRPLLEDQAEIQAAEVIKQMHVCGGYGTPTFTDPVTRELMKHRFVLSTLCRTMKDGEETWFVKDFVRAYQAFDKNREALLIEAPKELKQIVSNLFKDTEKEIGWNHTGGKI